MKKRSLLLIFSAVIAASCLLGCDSGSGIEEMTKDETLLPVDTISAEAGTLVIPETFMGNVSAERELKVYPRTTGEVTRINVKTGDYVNAGDVLFQLDDGFAQLDLESAKSNLSRTQAEVKKSQGSEEVLTQQKEWQGLENQNSRIADSSYSLTAAREDYDRQVHYLDEARDKENAAHDDYKKTVDKYEKAKGILEEYEALQASEPAFSQVTLDIAAEMDTSSGASQDHINYAKYLMTKLAGGEDDKLYPAEVTPSGVASLKSAKDSRYSMYSEYKSARESQEDRVTSAKRSADRAEKGLQDDYVSYRQDVDNMLIRDISLLEDNKRIQQIDINSSSLNVEKAEKSLEMYTVTAPISGYIGKVDIREYETVSTGTEAILIENTNSMTIEFFVTEKVRNNLKSGQELTVEKDDISAKGHIIEISDVSDASSGLFKIKAEMPGSTGIMNGTRVSVTLDSYRDSSGCIVPNDAVYHANGQEYIYVVENGKAVRRNVVTGLFDSDRIVISEGLNAGEHVITSWTSELKEGVKVEESLVQSPVVISDAVSEAPVEEVAADAQVPAAGSSDRAEDDDGAAAQTRVEATTTVFVRSAPNTDDNGNKLGKASAGDEFDSIGEENGWTRVIYNGSEAYIKSDYLRSVNGEAE